MLLFRAAEGRVTVSDGRTDVLLQTLKAWPHTANTTVTGVQATGDGSGLTVYLRTEFEGVPPIRREWSVTIDVYAGSVTPNLSADTLFAKPDATETRRAVTPDGRWVLAVDAANMLTVSPTGAPDLPSVSIPLDWGGIREPIRHIAFLEQGRHLLMRSGTHQWLLDFKMARPMALEGPYRQQQPYIPPEAYRSARKRLAWSLLALSDEGYGEQGLFRSG